MGACPSRGGRAAPATTAAGGGVGREAVARWRWSSWYWAGRWWVWRELWEQEEDVVDLGRWIWQDRYGWGWWRMVEVDGVVGWIWRSCRPSPGEPILDGDWRVQAGGGGVLQWRQWQEPHDDNHDHHGGGGAWHMGWAASPGMAWACW